jgi:hypothetical protein
MIDPAASLSTAFLCTITFDPATGAATIPTSGIAVRGTNPTVAGLSASPQGKYLACVTATVPCPAPFVREPVRHIPNYVSARHKPHLQHQFSD